MAPWSWQNVAGQPSRKYTCGHCGTDIAPDKGYSAVDVRGGSPQAFLYICHRCTEPSYLTPERQVPGFPPGASVSDVTDPGVVALYEETRQATAAGAYTAAVLGCRKLLMHLAVAKGAKAGESFVSYVDFLAGAGFVPPDGREWVDHIRTKGNEANHDIVIMTRDEAAELIAFVEMLLKFIYEFPAKMRRKVAQPPT